MSEQQIDHNLLSETDYLNKIMAITQRHIANIGNTLLMMKSGQFIEAFHRLQGSKEGLEYLQQLISSRHLNSIKVTPNENN